jgi:hypothetical protein
MVEVFTPSVMLQYAELCGLALLGHGDGLSELLEAESEEGEADGGDGQELGPDGLESGAAEDDGLREGDKVT